MPNLTHPLAQQPVLVTGADGFIGSHLAEALAQVGAKVRAFCLYNSQGSKGWLDHTPPKLLARMEIHHGDIRDARGVESAMEGMKYVFHLAALISIPYSYQAPSSYIQTNVVGTLNMLEAARRHPVHRFIQTSTSEVYGTPHQVPIRETHPLQAQSPYAASKIAADQLALSYFHSFNVPVVVLRPFNTYGPRQSTRAILSTMLVQLLNGRTEIELGRLSPRRDLTYVSDTVAGFLQAAVAEDVAGQTVQLGTGQSISMGELFERCCQTLGISATVKEDARRLRPSSSEVWELLSDPSLAAQRLGWQPQVSLQDGIVQTADWIKQHLHRFPHEFHV